MSKVNRAVLQRFALKGCLLMLFALAQWPCFSRALLLLCIMAASADAVLALLRREPIMGPTLNYWDEATAMLLISLAVNLAAPEALLTPYHP